MGARNFTGPRGQLTLPHRQLDTVMGPLRQPAPVCVLALLLFGAARWQTSRLMASLKEKEREARQRQETGPVVVVADAPASAKAEAPSPGAG